MRITAEVDIPNELITAANDGSIVFFVGAGVSLNEPSNLPLFDGLARKLAELQNVPFEEDVPPDAFVGRLCDKAPIVREQARRIISAPASRPNDTHRAIVRLADSSKAFRIVTTNYDEHLTLAAVEAGIEVKDVYHGPAVPLGRNFTGVVYLHGRVSRPAIEMVLTDDDFGRAYLTDGWARTFVQDLFMNRTVLFIGYSHNDSVMKYLARGLPPTTSRFALTEVPEDPKWKDLRITPVSYPGENKHAALTAVLEAWAGRLAMGQLEHRNRVKEIVAGEPPKLPVEADYISYAVTTPAGVRAFAEDARGVGWLRWAEEQRIFKRLFEAGDCLSDESRILASWFVEKYVSEPDSTDLAFGTLFRLGPVVCIELMRELVRATYTLGQSSPALFHKWTLVISGALRTHTTDPEEIWHILHNSALVGITALPLLRRATRPRLVLGEERSWFTTEAPPEPPRIKGTIAWSSKKASAQHLWEVVRGELPTLAADVLQVFEQSLRDAYEMLDAFNGESKWDTWGFQRSAIEKHDQDKMRNYESMLIDGLRDTSMLLSTTDRSIMPRWLSDRHVIFRRLGIHVLIEDLSTSAGQKLKILLDGKHLFDLPLKHEVYRLLATIASELNEEDRALLLSHILVGPPPFNPDPEKDLVLHERSIFDITEWLNRHVQGWQQLEIKLAEIRTNRPEIAVREHSNFNHWMESGSWSGKLPFGIDEFIELVENDGVHEAIRQLDGREYSERSFGEPTWEDAVSLIRQVVTKRPDLGFPLILSTDIKETTRQKNVISAVMSGWSEVSLSDSQVEDTLSIIEQFIDQTVFTRPISELCLSIVSKVESRDPHILNALDTIAAQIWRTHVNRFEETESDDWLLLGLNTWPGFLAQYWINRIRLRWRAAGDDWQGLLPAEKSMLSTMLGTTTAAGNPAIAILASDVYFLFAADNSFTVENIFSIFDEKVDKRAQHAWISYLHNPRADDALLSAGFWELLECASDLFADATNEHMDHQYWQMLASICIHSGASVIDRNRLVERLAIRDSGSQIVRFIDALADALRDLEPSEADQAWNSWLCGTVRKRSLSLPGVQTPAEKAAWGDLSLRIGNSMAEAIQLCDAVPGPLGSGTTFQDIPEPELRTHRDLLTKVVTHRIQATPQTDWHIDHELNSVADRLTKNSVDVTLLRAMAESALAIGVHSAAHWVS